MKKAKQNLFVDGVEYKAGHLYSPEAVAHIDASDFEEVEAQESDIIEATPEVSTETAETAEETVEAGAEETLE